MPKPTTAELKECLRINPFFVGLDEETLDTLVQGAFWREYASGEVVVLEGEASAGFYYLHSGWLKVGNVSLNGREQVLSFIEPSSTFYEVGAFSDQPNPATAVALEPAGVWLIKRERVMQLVRERPSFAEFILAKMADRLLHLVSLVTDLSLRPVTGRLAHLLLESAEEDILHRPRWYTQAELAARLGPVPDVIQRALRELEKEGLIEVTRRTIRILDRPALAAKVE
jgi:CRP/FNR family transcriptional regulator